MLYDAMLCYDKQVKFVESHLRSDQGLLASTRLYKEFERR